MLVENKNSDKNQTLAKMLLNVEILVINCNSADTELGMWHEIKEQAKYIFMKILPNICKFFLISQKIFRQLSKMYRQNVQEIFF